MLLIAAPLLIDASLSRTFLEEAQRLAGELARALHAHRRGTAGETERARLGDAIERMRRASAPLLAMLNPEQREAITGAQLEAAAGAGATSTRLAGARSRRPRPGA